MSKSNHLCICLVLIASLTACSQTGLVREKKKGTEAEDASPAGGTLESPQTEDEAESARPSLETDSDTELESEFAPTLSFRESLAKDLNQVPQAIDADLQEKWATQLSDCLADSDREIGDRRLCMTAIQDPRLALNDVSEPIRKDLALAVIDSMIETPAHNLHVKRAYETHGYITIRALGLSSFINSSVHNDLERLGSGDSYLDEIFVAQKTLREQTHNLIKEYL